MTKNILQFGETVVEINVVDNIIFTKIIGAYTDEIALELVREIDKINNSTPLPLIRVWDAGQIPSGLFNLSHHCMEEISMWSNELTKKKPGSTAYMISPYQFSFGMSRMYQQTTDSESVIVLRSFNELPEAIKSKLIEIY